MGRRDSERGDINKQRTRREIYSVIETLMAFVRNTCQGQVKMTSVKDKERDEMIREERRGQLESGFPVRRGPRPCQPHLIANLCKSTDIKCQ